MPRGSARQFRHVVWYEHAVEVFVPEYADDLGHVDVAIVHECFGIVRNMATDIAKMNVEELALATEST